MDEKEFRGTSEIKSNPLRQVGKERINGSVHLLVLPETVSYAIFN
jgi:hypothetical protein